MNAEIPCNVLRQINEKYKLVENRELEKTAYLFLNNYRNLDNVVKAGDLGINLCTNRKVTNKDKAIIIDIVSGWLKVNSKNTSWECRLIAAEEDIKEYFKLDAIIRRLKRKKQLPKMSLRRICKRFEDCEPNSYVYLRSDVENEIDNVIKLIELKKTLRKYERKNRNKKGKSGIIIDSEIKGTRLTHHIICPTCSGEGGIGTGCFKCGGSGWVSES